MSLRLTLALDQPDLQSISHMKPVARLENRGKKPLSAVIHATPLSHGEYSIEVQDARGRPVRLNAIEMCGMMSPLMEHEIFIVEPGASVDLPIPMGNIGPIPPGSYRARVTYRAHHSDSHKENWTPVVKDRLRHFWTGTLSSDWTPFTIRPTA
jgi:hypothetical protein